MLPAEIILISFTTSFFSTIFIIITCSCLCKNKDKEIKELKERNAYLEKNIDKLFERVRYYEELVLWRGMTKE